MTESPMVRAYARVVTAENGTYFKPILGTESASADGAIELARAYAVRQWPAPDMAWRRMRLVAELRVLPIIPANEVAP